MWPFRKPEPEQEPEPEPIPEPEKVTELEPSYCGPRMLKRYRVSIRPGDEKECDAAFEESVASKFQVKLPAPQEIRDD